MSGAAAVALTWPAFPQCLAGPYGALSPEMAEILNAVLERRNIVGSLAENPDIALCRSIARPAVGFTGLILAASLYPRGQRFAVFVVLSAALAATAIAMVEERGNRISQPLALVGSIPLAAWIAHWRGRARLAMPFGVAGLLVLMTPVGYALLPTTAGAIRGGPEGPGSAGSPGPRAWLAELEHCVADAEMAPVAMLPPGRVLTRPYVGNFLLLKTPHASIGGELHRNQEGYVAAMRLQRADAETAYHLLSRYRADYLAYCSFQGESKAAGSLFAQLRRGAVPDWLVPLPGGERLRIYRFVPPGG